MTRIDDIRRAKALKLLSECWVPHKGQKAAGQALFESPADIVYVECGRKWGKSEFAVYTCWLYAILNNNAEVYYLAPQVDQVKELVWANYRMQSCNTYKNDFLSQMERILGGPIKVYNQEKRLVFPNGSFIKCHGSDNYNAQRGLKPDFIVADEYRDFKPEWIEAVRPNMLVKRGKMLFITTPPHGPNQAYDLAVECKEGIAAGDKTYFYINQPTLINDRIEGLEVEVGREERRLKKLGRYNEYLREYKAMYIVSDENAVIPQLNRELMVPHDQIVQEIRESSDKLEFYCVLNPGNSTIFGISLYCVNRHTGQLWLLDEKMLYDSNKTSIRSIWPSVVSLIDDLMVNRGKDLTFEDVNISVAGEKPWIVRDLLDLEGVVANLTTKDCKKVDYNVNLIKDIAMARRLILSDRCSALVRESETYQRSRKTFKIPGDETKLLLYNLRAVLYEMGYTTDLLSKPIYHTPSEILNNAELYIKAVQGSRSFDDVCRDIRTERFGVLDDDMDALFGDDME